MLTIAHIQAMDLHIHTQGRFNNGTAHSLYRIMVMATSVVGVMNMGNIASRARTEPTPLILCASVLTSILHRLPGVTTLTTPTWLCGSLPEGLMQTTTYIYVYSTTSLTDHLHRLTTPFYWSLYLGPK